MNITFDPKEYEVGTLGTGQIAQDFYKYRPIVTRIVFIEMMAENINKGYLVPPDFVDLSESDKADNLTKFKECVECAKIYLKWSINEISGFIHQWCQCFPGFEKYLDEETTKDE